MKGWAVAIRDRYGELVFSKNEFGCIAMWPDELKRQAHIYKNALYPKSGFVVRVEYTEPKIVEDET